MDRLKALKIKEGDQKVISFFLLKPSMFMTLCHKLDDYLISIVYICINCVFFRKEAELPTRPPPPSPDWMSRFLYKHFLYICKYIYVQSIHRSIIYNPGVFKYTMLSSVVTQFRNLDCFIQYRLNLQDYNFGQRECFTNTHKNKDLIFSFCKYVTGILVKSVKIV